MDIDRKRIAAVHTLEALGYAYSGGEWLAPADAAQRGQRCHYAAIALGQGRRLHGALMRRADALAGCTEGSADEAALETIIDLIETYEANRWPLGKDPNVPGSFWPQYPES